MASGWFASLVDDPDKRRKLIFVLAAVVILAVIAGVVLLVVNKKPNCKLSDEIPASEVDKIKAVSSKNKKALARMDGYLSMWVDNGGKHFDNKYLKFELNEVEYTELDRTNAELVLKAECGRIVFQVFRDNSSMAYRIRKMTVVPDESSSCAIARCEINLEFMNFIYTDYWSCIGERRYQCSRVMPNSAKVSYVGVHFNLLEFELDGEPENMAAGQFDKAPKVCSQND